jgi:hypothetical protein
MAAINIAIAVKFSLSGSPGSLGLLKLGTGNTLRAGKYYRGQA